MCRALEAWNKPAVFARLSETLCVWVCGCICASESHLRAGAGQCLVKDLRSDLIFFFWVPDMIEPNVFWFLLDTVLILEPDSENLQAKRDWTDKFKSRLECIILFRVVSVLGTGQNGPQSLSWGGLIWLPEGNHHWPAYHSLLLLYFKTYCFDSVHNLGDPSICK